MEHNDIIRMLGQKDAEGANQPRKALSRKQVFELKEAIERNVVTPAELIEQGLMTEEACNMLMQLNTDTLPYLDDYILREENPEVSKGSTDVFFFGLPESGKTCILTALTDADIEGCYINKACAGGMYAQVLTQYAMAGVVPPMTSNKGTAVMRGKIEKSTVKRDADSYEVNFVEMSGEEYLVQATSQTAFEARKGKAAGLLANPNEKVLFIVIDPTRPQIEWSRLQDVLDSKGRVIDERIVKESISQKQVHELLLSQLMQPANNDLMKKVRAIHVIVTKADTLGDTQEERDLKAYSLVENNYKALMVDIEECSKRYSMTTKPQVITFSLGRLYWDLLFKRQPDDVKKLLDLLRQSIHHTEGEPVSRWLEKVFGK